MQSCDPKSKAPAVRRVLLLAAALFILLPFPSPTQTAGGISLKLIDVIEKEWEPYAVDGKGGSITQHTASYQNDYSWTPVPGDMGPDGIMMTLTVATQPPGRSHRRHFARRSRFLSAGNELKKECVQMTS